MTRRRLAVALGLALLIGLASSMQPSGTAAPEADGPRDSRWAEPLADRAGLPNLYRVSEGLYRGAQPSKKEGFESLAEIGIKTVVNLRGGHDEAKVVHAHGLDYVYIPMRAWSFDEEDVIRFLQVATLPANQPVFVHCRRGADRTGMAVAVYRVVVEHWSREDALAEMIEGPYDYNPRWKDLVRFVQTMDVERLREAVETSNDGEQ
jgi:protein tyrosine/serine phosphatase